MHVFNLDRKHVRRDRNLNMVQLSLALVVFVSFTAGMVAFGFRGSDTPVFDAVVQGVGVVFGLGAYIFLVYRYFKGHRGRVRIVITRQTLALKFRNKPAVFLKKQDCVAYGPLKHVFTLADGTEFSLLDLELPYPNIKTLNEFIFTHWWSPEGLKALEAHFEEELPMPRWHVRAVFLTCILIGLMMIVLIPLETMGAISQTAFFGALIGAIVSLAVSSTLIRTITSREKEREAFRVSLARDSAYATAEG